MPHPLLKEFTQKSVAKSADAANFVWLRSWASENCVYG
jgi:hypothetical protein